MRRYRGRKNRLSERLFQSKVTYYYDKYFQKASPSRLFATSKIKWKKLNKVGKLFKFMRALRD